ncbi:NAD-dependent epimerase/dehydratase family protein [Cuniculiplasma sp. SKW4]|uniref:NAD-dependent epimerase/dehydratase family protein n=1 Tax=Cuniculiplasma sp. SKW4 TaxID=3400171 RepID=UPI003FD4F841
MKGNILIFGGNGFLGSHLSDFALRQGYDVTVVDDLSTMETINISRNVKFIRARIENYHDEEEYKYVIHLAARPSPEDYIDHPLDTLSSNSWGTQNALEIARRNKATFMYTSSSEVYGDAKLIPTPESYYGYVNPNGIRSCYDEGKRFSEALIMSYHRYFKMDTRIQRPFNVYGPRIREDGQYGRVIPRFITAALKDEDIIVFGDGNQTRSFLYIEDWVKATWDFLTKDGIGGSILNIGATEEISINNLANKIIELTNSQSKIIHKNARVDDPYRRSADTSLARKLINFAPSVGLEDGIMKTIKWFREKML